jgi:diphthamide synthase (EF-2-diphthine--ammonia ligase)
MHGVRELLLKIQAQSLGLPGNVDPCGENGEFHSFVFDFLSRTDLGGR